MNAREAREELGDERTSEAIRKELQGLLDKDAFEVMQKDFNRYGIL